MPEGKLAAKVTRISRKGPVKVASVIERESVRPAAPKGVLGGGRGNNLGATSRQSAFMSFVCRTLLPYERGKYKKLKNDYGAHLYT